jgi:hypothetical protein
MRILAPTRTFCDHNRLHASLISLTAWLIFETLIAVTEYLHIDSTIARLLYRTTTSPLERCTRTYDTHTVSTNSKLLTHLYPPLSTETNTSPHSTESLVITITRAPLTRPRLPIFFAGPITLAVWRNAESVTAKCREVFKLVIVVATVPSLRNN